MRIFLHPGKVRSKNDHDRHYISAGQLAKLYGVDLRQCHVITNDPSTFRGLRPQGGDIHLYPKFNGNYRTQAGEV